MPGLNTTFELLATTANGKAAVASLTAALDVPDARIQTLAIEALVRRPGAPFIEIVRRVFKLPHSTWEVLEKHKRVLGPVLRQCLSGTDEVLQRSALRLAEVSEDFALIPTLLTLLERPAEGTKDDVTTALRALVNRLYEHLLFGREASLPIGARPTEVANHAANFLKDAQKIRHLTLAALESSARKFELHRCAFVIEALFILGDSENLIVKRLLRESPSLLRAEAENVLLTSAHPAVLQLICDSLNCNFPLPQAFDAFERRADPEFVCHVLRQWPRKPTPNQLRNYHEIQILPWLTSTNLDLEMIPPGLQRQLTAFLLAVALPDDDLIRALEWLVRHGDSEGRLSATQALAGLHDDRVQEVVLDGLESKVPDVQAWATQQLRSRDIPGAIEKLVERLDSPLPEVRAAARAELGDFNIHRVLELYEDLDPRIARSVGLLIHKIDPETLSKLKSEMHHSIQRRRIRAIRCAQKLGLHAELVPQVALMLQDPDPTIRRSALEVLGDLPEVAVNAITPLLTDPSPRVREAAAAALGLESGVRS